MVRGTAREAAVGAPGVSPGRGVDGRNKRYEETSTTEDSRGRAADEEGGVHDHAAEKGEAGALGGADHLIGDAEAFVEDLDALSELFLGNDQRRDDQDRVPVDVGV